jgi:Cu+-exporting ATPase
MKNLLIILMVLALVSCESAGNKSNPEKQSVKQTATVQATINIGGMHCENCVASVEKGIKALEGIDSVSVSLSDSTAVVLFDPANVDIEKIGKAIEGRGFTVKK